MTDESRVQRSYALVNHAENLTRGLPNEFAISDAVSNLKRAINIRVQLLEASYSFSKAFPKSIGTLERLESVNLARPYLIKQLFSLRNDIEHHDAPPPTLDRCRELIALTWYFLKATDSASRTVGDSLEYEYFLDDKPEKIKLGFTANLVSVVERKFKISGWFEPPFLSFQETDLRVNAEVVRGRPTRLNSGRSTNDLPFDENSARGESERWIQGSVVVPSEILYQFWRDIFK